MKQFILSSDHWVLYLCLYLRFLRLSWLRSLEGINCFIKDYTNLVRFDVEKNR